LQRKRERRTIDGEVLELVVFAQRGGLLGRLLFLLGFCRGLFLLGGGLGI
jgi:hypothetical protein